MSTQERVIPRAADQASHQAEEPKATLEQLTELTAQMSRGAVLRSDLQNFLRRRNKPEEPKPLIKPKPRTMGQDYLQMIEANAKRLFPSYVKEILELVGPWLDPDLNLEFVYPKTVDASQALWDWYSPAQTMRMALTRENMAEVVFGGDPHYRRVSDIVFERMYAREYDLITTMHYALKIGLEQLQLHFVEQHVRTLYSHTYAERYNLLHHHFRADQARAVHFALTRAIMFLVMENPVYLGRVKAFLDFQRSGTPILGFKTGVCGHDAWVLTAPAPR